MFNKHAIKIERQILTKFYEFAKLFSILISKLASLINGNNDTGGIIRFGLLLIRGFPIQLSFDI